MKLNEIIELENAYSPRIYHPLPVAIAKGKGPWVWDIDDKKYLDLTGTFSAVSHGHCHPRLVNAAKEQLEKITLPSRAVYSENLGLLMEKICAISGMDMAISMNSGSEAVETAIKAIRRWGYIKKKIPEDQAEIIVATNNFHGRTTTLISCSSENSYRMHFGPFTPGFRWAAFGDAIAFEKTVSPQTAAFLVEPIQGERGIIIPPHSYFKKVSEICKKHQILLILDEIQSGLGRTGKMFAYQHEGIKPDGIILGKALGGGIYPVSAFAAKREILELLDLGSHGSSYAGNSLAARIALEAILILEEEGLIENSEKLGSYFLEQLKKRIGKSFLLREIRGRGLWVALDFHKKILPARNFCEKLMAEGVLTKDTHQTVVRLSPPLLINQEELDFALERIEKVTHFFEKSLPKGEHHAA